MLEEDAICYRVQAQCHSVGNDGYIPDFPILAMLVSMIVGSFWTRPGVPAELTVRPLTVSEATAA